MEESRKIVRTAILVLILIVAAGGVYYLFLADRSGGGSDATRPGSEGVTRPAPAAAGPSAEGSVSAPLDGSDGLVRELSGAVSVHPIFARWMGSTGLIRRFVAAVDAIANGASPRSQADFFPLSAPIAVARRGGRTYLDPASYERYNVVADVFSSVSAVGCAKLYRDFQSQIRQAYRELGYPQGDFHRVLLKAINEILKAPVIESPIEVEKSVAVYICLDPRLEGLSAVQKHLLRMGPDNTQLIQAKLRELAAALGFAEAELAAPGGRTSGARGS